MNEPSTPWLEDQLQEAVYSILALMDDERRKIDGMTRAQWSRRHTGLLKTLRRRPDSRFYKPEAADA